MKQPRKIVLEFGADTQDGVTSATAFGHCLGVNSLVNNRNTLYSAGRDGQVIAWWLDADTNTTTPVRARKIHSNWVNGLTRVQTRREFGNNKSPKKSRADGNLSYNVDRSLHKTQDGTSGSEESPRTTPECEQALNNDCIISCSSDLTVKIWNPGMDEVDTIGQHKDYVKCVASGLANQNNVVVSGGLDRKICGWNIETCQQLFSLDAAGKDSNDKASVYTLAVAGGHSRYRASNNNNNYSNDAYASEYSDDYSSPCADLIASGSPDGIVRLWDSRAPKQVGQLIGHTDNIRDVLVSADGELVLSASSDATVRLWSVSTARILHTFQMHRDSVWTLHSEDPDLKTFYSGDRSGEVYRSVISRKPQLQLVCNEHEGIFSLATYNGNLWTATSNARIHRWKDLAQPRQEPKTKLSTVKECSISPTESPTPTIKETDSVTTSPIETLQGQVGIVKHQLLADKRRALTLDSSGKIIMWDLMSGKPIHTFSREKDLDTLTDELSSKCEYVVANWCQVSVRTGALCMALDPHSCFQAEVYFDELLDNERININHKATENDDDDHPTELASNSATASATHNNDQRINYGRWIISNLFHGVLENAIKELPHGTRAGSVRQEPSSVTEIVAMPSVNAETAASGASSAPSPNSSNSNADEPKKKFGRFFKLKRDNSAQQQQQQQHQHQQQQHQQQTAQAQAAAQAAQNSSHVPANFANLGQVVHYVTSDTLHTPSPEEAPPLTFPQNTRLCISEGGIDLWRGTVADMSSESEYHKLKTLLPGWVGQVLLQDRLPKRDLPKVGFVTIPDEQPAETGMGDGPAPAPTRLFAYNMLRANKVVEHICNQLQQGPNAQQYHHVTPQMITLSCHDQNIALNMTLGAIRTKIWKSGGDIVFKYHIKEDIIL